MDSTRTLGRSFSAGIRPVPRGAYSGVGTGDRSGFAWPTTLRAAPLSSYADCQTPCHIAVRSEGCTQPESTRVAGELIGEGTMKHNRFCRFLIRGKTNLPAA